MSPEGLGTTTTGLTQGVGPSTGSMMSWLTSSSSFCSIFSLNQNGEGLNVWAVGWTDLSTWNLAWKSLSFPTLTKFPQILSACSPHWQSLSRFSILPTVQRSVGWVLALPSLPQQRNVQHIVYLYITIQLQTHRQCWVVSPSHKSTISCLIPMTYTWFSYFWAPTTSPCQWHCKWILNQQAQPPVVPLQVQWLLLMSLTPDWTVNAKSSSSVPWRTRPFLVLSSPLVLQNFGRCPVFLHFWQVIDLALHFESRAKWPFNPHR